MGKYEDLTKDFYDKYEEPVVEEYIVGFSGLDPDKRIEAGELDHEKLAGLLGGDFSGHYHLTHEQVRQIASYQERLDQTIEYNQTAISELQSETHQAITEIRTESEQASTEIRNETEKAVSDLKAEKDREIQAVNAELSTAKTQLTQKVSEIDTRQSAVEGSQDSIRARFDAVLEGITEDSEILDARVDAENVRHQNLGNNIRAIHQRLLTETEKSRQRDDDIHSHLQEQAYDLAGAVLINTEDIYRGNQRLSSLEEAQEQIRHWEKRYAEAEERLREATRDNTEAIFTLAFLMQENTEEHRELSARQERETSQTRKRLNDYVNGLQEQINELAYMKLSDVIAGRELEDRLSQIEGELDAIESEIDPEGTATDDEMNEALDDAFSGDSMPDSDLEPEFERMLDEIYGVNP